MESCADNLTYEMREWESVVIFIREKHASEEIYFYPGNVLILSILWREKEREMIGESVYI